jgi:hypothetical protein
MFESTTAGDIENAKSNGISVTDCFHKIQLSMEKRSDGKIKDKPKVICTVIFMIIITQLHRPPPLV